MTWWTQASVVSRTAVGSTGGDVPTTSLQAGLGLSVLVDAATIKLNV